MQHPSSIEGTHPADLGYASVRMVAVDEDWSALRFRKTEYIGR
jgi:hypothetical protein